MKANLSEYNIKRQLQKDVNEIEKRILKLKKGYQYNQKRVRKEIYKLINKISEYDNITLSPFQISLISAITNTKLKQSKSKSIRELRITTTQIKGIKPKPKLILHEKLWNELSKEEQQQIDPELSKYDFSDLDEMERQLGID